MRELGEHPDLIVLGAGLGVGAMLAHSIGRLFGQPLTLAVLASAQLGVPVAAATLGTEQHLLAPGEPSALMLGAIVTIAATSIAGVLAARRQSAENPALRDRTRWLGESFGLTPYARLNALLNANGVL